MRRQKQVRESEEEGEKEHKWEGTHIQTFACKSRISDGLKQQLLNSAWIQLETTHSWLQTTEEQNEKNSTHTRTHTRSQTIHEIIIFFFSTILLWVDGLCLGRLSLRVSVYVRVTFCLCLVRYQKWVLCILLFASISSSLINLGILVFGSM